MNSFYLREELIELGIKSIGENVLISKKASIYSPQCIEIGDNVRIDDFCVISGKVVLGNYIHIAAGCYIFGGQAGVFIDDFSTISSRGAIYALTDDYSGEFMTNPMVNTKYTNVKQEPVYVRKHVVIGTNSTILPGIKIGEGCAFGANSLIISDCEAWTIYVGSPVKKFKERKKDLLKYEEEITKSNKN